MKSLSRTSQTEKYIKKRRNKKIIKILLYFLFSLAIISIIIFFFRFSFLQISHIDIEGAKTINTDEIQKKAISSLQGNYFGFIPRSSFFFFSKSDIKKDILDNFKKVSSIEISRVGLSTLKLKLEERVPEAIACEGFKEDADNVCYFVDHNAFIFERTSGNITNSYIKYYINSDIDQLNIGNTFIESSRFGNLQTFMKNIKDSKISIIGILISGNGAYELYIKNIDNSDAVVYFDDKVPFEKTQKNLIAFWQNAVDKKSSSSTVPIFDYVNLRFGNNIFFLTK